MPQEQRVVRCGACDTFQVDIVKKSNQWKCKVCDFKQSLQIVFFVGSGFECRKVTQELNKQSIEVFNSTSDISKFIDSNNFKLENSFDVAATSKWDEHLTDNEVIGMDLSTDEEEEEASGYDDEFKTFMLEQGIVAPYSKVHEEELMAQFRENQSRENYSKKVSKGLCQDDDASSSEFKENYDVNAPKQKDASPQLLNEPTGNIFGNIDTNISEINDILNDVTE